MRRQLANMFYCALLNSGIALGQINTGALSGFVTDPSGAAIAATRIEIRSLDTGVSAASISNGSGLYKAPFLRPGSYSVRIDAPGFRTWEAEAVEILVGRETVVNASLAIGDAAESVTVEGTAPLVDSTAAQASVNLDNRRILHLPRLAAGLDHGVTNGLDKLALLAPGIAPTSANTVDNGAVFSANGQRPRSNAMLQDGQDNVHRIFGGPRFPFGVIEAVSEYQVIGNQFSAEYGLVQGSVVNVTTRGGTNQFHGTLNWLHRNDAHLAALTNIERRSGVTVPPKFIDNRYGVTLGGPLRKDMAFFFAHFDRQTARRDRRVEAGPGLWTPSEQGLRTLSEAFPDSNTVAALLRHGPLTRSEGNPQFLPGLRLEPLRSPAGGPVSVEMGRLVRYFKAPIDTLYAGIRTDVDVNSRNRVTARYFHRESEIANERVSLSGYVLDLRTPMRSVAVNWSRTVSPSVVNEARFGYDYALNEYADPSGAPYGQMGRNISEFIPPPGYVGFGLPNNMPQTLPAHSAQAADNVSHYLGRHALKYGFQWNRFWADIGNRSYYNGQFQFRNLQEFVDNTPIAFNGADGPLFTYDTSADQAYYFQDDFRFRPNLTLNLGVRYEVPANATKVGSNISVRRESDPNTAIWNTALPIEARTNVAVGRDWNNWAPRLGFAWNPRGPSWLLGAQRTVIRGGYGISYDFPYGLLAADMVKTAPLALRYSLPGATARVPHDVTGDGVRRVMQPPRGLDPRQLTIAEFSPDFRSPMLHSWSFGVQRRVGASQAFEVRYVGNRGIGLFQSRNANPNVQNYIDAGFPQVIPSGVRSGANPSCAACTGRVNPDYGFLAVVANTASSTYHGLQTRYEGRPLRQLNLGAAYTWSRAIDNSSDHAIGSGPQPQNPFDITSGERGPSSFDRTHLLALHFVWDVPGFQSQRGALGWVLGGWSLAGIVRSYSGAPVTPLQRNTEPRTANDLAFYAAFGANPDTRRPFSSNPDAALNRVGFVQPDGSMVDFYQRSLPVTPDSVRWIYNNNAAARLLGTPFGAGRNVLRAPPVHQTDLSLFKNMRLTERATLQLRLEAENALNHPNLGIGVTLVDVPVFLNPTETQAAPRRVAVGMRLLF
jgi:hypothetical protein